MGFEREGGKRQRFTSQRKELLRITISERVQKGTELFAFYGLGEDESGEDDS